MEQVRIVERGEDIVQDAGTVALQGAVSAEQAALGEGEHALSGHGPSAGNGDRPAVPRLADGGPEHAREAPQPDAWNETNGRILANVYTDPTRHTVSLLLDDRTANAVVYAARLLVADLEARAREARLASAMLPTESYGAVNRLAIAGRHERLAGRLRVLEGNYRAQVNGGWTPRERLERE
jgi:hypothetical protein